LKNPVSIAAVPEYGEAAILDAVKKLLAPLGGMSAFVQAGQKVLIKPNMLLGKPAEKAVTTHPDLVWAVIRLVQECGATALVGDSPGVGLPRAVAKKCGILSVIEKTGATLALFNDSVPFPNGTGLFHKLEIARDAAEADVIINLAKLKTHQMMGLTGGVKNMFGVIVGFRKVNLHFQAGSDKGLFAGMLLDLAKNIAPALTIVDAVTAMEGNGPGNGTPVHIGALIAGTNPLAVDTVIIKMLGVAPDSVWTQKVAREQLMSGSSLNEVQITGPEPESLRPPQFKKAKATEIGFGLPAILRKTLKKSLSTLPKKDPDLCITCGICIRHCPAEAMSIVRGHVRINYKRCIGCFCCQELCPVGAIQARQGLLLRFFRLFSKKYRGG
jgi:uncharacterized protein (DUF362 family)/NAD-dependent dihydropyrimidine dehydrogenase PreA subunit